MGSHFPGDGDHMAGPRDDPGRLPGCFARCSLSQNPLQLEVAMESSFDKGNMKSEEEFLRKASGFLGKVTGRTACPLCPSPYMDMVPGAAVDILGNPEGNKLEGKTQDVRGKR